MLLQFNTQAILHLFDLYKSHSFYTIRSHIHTKKFIQHKKYNTHTTRLNNTLTRSYYKVHTIRKIQLIKYNMHKTCLYNTYTKLNFYIPSIQHANTTQKSKNEVIPKKLGKNNRFYLSNKKRHIYPYRIRVQFILTNKTF